MSLDLSNDYQQLAEAAAGNHRKFECFAWWDRPEDDWDWTLVYTENRDSDIATKSNSQALAKELEPFIDDGTVREESHNHWAVGWVAGFAIRVFDDERNVTPAFKKWVDLNRQLEDYCLLDEEDYFEREREELRYSLECECPSDCIDDLPEDWESEVLDWLDSNDRYPRENWYASSDVRDAFEALGWLESEKE